MYPENYGLNPLYPSSSDFKVVKRDQTSGLGVITCRSFAPGDVVAALAGETVYEMTQHTLQIEPGMHLLDLHFCGYFLHSCEPNVHLDMRKLLVLAIRPIHPYDHLLMDYAQTEDVLFKQFPCHCGSGQCRGWITGREEQPNLHDSAYQAFLRHRRFVA
jgi:hypothetical protein